MMIYKPPHPKKDKKGKGEKVSPEPYIPEPTVRFEVSKAMLKAVSVDQEVEVTLRGKVREIEMYEGTDEWRNNSICILIDEVVLDADVDKKNEYGKLAEEMDSES